MATHGAQIARCLVGEFGPKRTLVVAAHPDDEIVGLGGHLPYLAPTVCIVHATDGAPPWADASLAQRREDEALAALAVGGVSQRSLVRFGFSDQRLVDDAADFARRLRELIVAFAPELVLSAPFEGGHPDHDACAWAVASAVADTQAEHWEWASYHAAPDGAFVAGAFLEDTSLMESISLSAEAAALKRRMFECHASQRDILELFDVGTESFRRAPRYDFTQRPAKQMFYESRPWDMTFERFTQRLCHAQRGR